MKLVLPGLRGKFVGALLMAAALPLLVALFFLETLGYRHLLAERGKVHLMQAQSLVRAINDASSAQGGKFRTWIAADPTILTAVVEKNHADSGRVPAEIDAEIQQIDEIWPSLASDDSRLKAVIGNPAAENLRTYQTLYPALAEILVTDQFGRLVAASGKSSDFGQADEEWWQQGKMLESDREWIDTLRYDASSQVFSLDVILPIYDRMSFAGVVKMTIDVTSLFRNLRLSEDDKGERWEIALPDGRILASSRSDVAPLEKRLTSGGLKKIESSSKGWALISSPHDEPRMVGFVALGGQDSTPGAYIMFSSRRSEVVASLRSKLIWVGLLGSMLIGGCALAGYKYIALKVLQPLALLGGAARSISTTARLRMPGTGTEAEINQGRLRAEKELEKIQSIHTGDEVESLAADLAIMASRVLRYHRELETEVEAKTEIIREDLEMAREFQNALLPSVYPDVPPLEVANPLRLKFAHFYQPASTVGGDFFDLIELDESRVGVLIADVMGHGSRSALVTAILRALARNYANIASEPGAFLSELNRHLHEMISRSGHSLFVTAFFIVLDTRNCSATWAVSGHPAPLRVRRGSGHDPEPLWNEPPRQPALGLVPNFSYRSCTSPLHAGDVFLLFTDGSVEAENPAGESFGMQRLIASMDQALDGPMAAMPAKIICDVTFFQKRRNYDDDVCIVAIEACGGEATHRCEA